MARHLSCIPFVRSRMNILIFAEVLVELSAISGSSRWPWVCAGDKQTMDPCLRDSRGFVAGATASQCTQLRAALPAAVVSNTTFTLRLIGDRVFSSVPFWKIIFFFAEVSTGDINS